MSDSDGAAPNTNSTATREDGNEPGSGSTIAPLPAPATGTVLPKPKAKGLPSQKQGKGLKHVVKYGKAKATVWMHPLKQESTEPYDGNADNQGGFQTGQYLWDSGLYLARWVLGNRDRIRGQSVVEIGSGLGLVGLTAAKFARKTVLSDCAEDIVASLSRSIVTNDLGRKGKFVVT